MRATSMVGTLTCLLLAAGCSSPAHQDGNAAPAGSPEPTTSAATTGTPTPSTPPSSPPSSPSSPSSARPASDPTRPASLVLGPDGIGSLKLGMTRQQATGTGLLRTFTNNAGGCAPAHLRAAPTGDEVVLLSPTLGIATIDAYAGIRTPEGARIGMSSAEMLRIYPTWKAADGDATNGRGTAKTPGNSKAVYRIETKNGKVISLTLQYANQDCYE
ncbi:hypothetical protein AB0B39_31900 [Micromonospora sp. NPDC049114]|uniref:hypothetical protein n=1 Tax=Micromonospora sp. NPDC049114 TaxID=3155498 RepID=UPI0033EFAE5A